MNGIMKKIARLRRTIVPLVLIMTCVTITTPMPVFAATVTPGGAGDNCTNFRERMDEIFGKGPTVTPAPAPGGGPATPQKGILTQIYDFIKEIVDDATKTIFKSFVQNSNYQMAVYAATVLSVALFGVFFTIGLVQLTAGQVLMRLIKIGVIFSVVSPGGWGFFNDIVVNFFNNGTDEIVTGVIRIAAGGGSIPPDASPFYQLDKLGEFLINPQTLTMILGSLTSGPFGMGMGALSMMAFGAFLKMLIDALRSYAICFVVRSLLLGLAPIFIVFLLFERTKQLFNTWLNSLISCSLQPILLFTFLAFFTVMLESATKNMFSAELCFAEFEQAVGSTNRISGWRFKSADGSEILIDENTWRGNLSCLLRGSAPAGGATPTGGAAATPDCPEFPIKILDVLTFLMLVFLASRFAEVIDRVANELSSTFIALDPAGKMDQFMNEAMSGGGARGSGSQQSQASTPRPSSTGRGGT